jgi:hypothetical protein
MSSWSECSVEAGRECVKGRDQRLKELDETRRVQILLNRELERQAKVAELEEDWELLLAFPILC